MIRHVELSDRAKKQLRKLPRHIADKLLAWVGSVEAKGLEEVRKLPGYHDEPLKGDRKGQRSIRLSRAYVIRGQEITFVCVEEVSKHDY